MKTESELRDQIAIHAMSAFIARLAGHDSYDEGGVTFARVANAAHKMADAMLAARAQSAQPAEPVADSDGWIKWEGGRCPVGHAVRVEIHMRDGFREVGNAGSFYWKDDGDTCDITAYRLAREPV